MSDDYADQMAERIKRGEKTHVPRMNSGADSKETTHICVADADGNCVEKTENPTESPTRSPTVTDVPADWRPTLLPSAETGTGQAPTGLPSFGPQCRDDVDGKFKVADRDQDCEWLVDRIHDFGYLCGFVDVAEACPATCGRCEVVSPPSCDDQQATHIELPGAPKDVATCDYLKTNLDRFGFACRRTSIALACPQTCELDSCKNYDQTPTQQSDYRQNQVSASTGTGTWSGGSNDNNGA